MSQDITSSVMDIVQETLHQEWKSFDETGQLSLVSLCTKVAGGLLDYPKVVPKSIAVICKKWDNHFTRLFIDQCHSPSPSTYCSVSPESESKTAACEGIASAAELVTVVDQSAGKIEEHLLKIVEHAADKGHLQILHHALSASVLVRNTLWSYEDFCKKSQQENLFRPAYKLFCSLADALAEQVLESHNSRAATSVLMSADCQEWKNPKPFFEGQRGSFAVQMWWFYIKGLHQDLWHDLPPKIAQRILAAVVNESLSILTTRYTQAYPSPARCQQFVNDIVNILLCVSELVLCLCTGSSQLSGHSESKTIDGILAKCDLLFCCLIFIGSTLQSLHQGLKRGLSSAALSQKENNLIPVWFSMLRHDICMQTQPVHSTVDLRNPLVLDLCLDVAIVGAQPEPAWPAIVKVLLMNNCFLSTLILSSLGNMVCKNATYCTSTPFSSCGKLLCEPGSGVCRVDGKCASHVICSSIFHLLAYTKQSRKQVKELMLPILKQFGDWSILDKTEVWNARRPAWYQSLVEVVEPYLEPAILSLVLDEEWSEERDVDVSRAVSSLLSSLADMVVLLPPMLGHLFLELDEILPVDIQPLGGSVGLHIVVSSLYSMLNSLQQMEDLVGASMGEGDKDLLIAVGEHMCHVDKPQFHPKLERIVEQLKNQFQGDYDEIYDDDMSETVSEIIANTLMSTSKGQQSLQIMHWFMTSNQQWLQNAMGISKRKVDNESIRLVKERAEILVLNYFQYIGQRKFDEVLRGEFSIDWALLMEKKLGITADLARHFVFHRHEFQPKAELGPATQDLVQSLKKLLEK